MTKKKKHNHQNRNTADNYTRPEHCKFDARSVYPVRVEPTTEDHQWQRDQKDNWAKQLALGKALNRITAAGAIAAVVYGFIAYLQWSDAHTNFRIDQRAWVNVGVSPQPPIPVQVNGPLTALITVTNTGKTAALGLASNYYVEVVKNGQNPHFETNIPHMRAITGILTPNSPLPQQIAMQRLKAGTTTDETEDQPLTDRDKSLLDSGDAWIAVHGTIYYRDIFQNQHWIKFCSWNALRAGWHYSAAACVTYNNTDTNQ